MKQTVLIALALFVFCGTISRVSAHNHLISPVPRDTRGTYDGNNNCENGNGNFPGGNNFQRGQKVTSKWSWNNHRGGFVRYSIVPMGKENNRGIFNTPENIIHYACHTKDCGGRGARFDSGDKFPCSTQFTIPTHLKNGNYVLQWIVYSMHDSNGRVNEGLPNYTSCANIRINGGPQTNNLPGKCSFTWSGGDKEYTNRQGGRGDTCVYFMRNTLGNSRDTVKLNAAFIKVNGRPAEVEACLKSGGVGRAAGGAAEGGNAPAPAGGNGGNNGGNNGGLQLAGNTPDGGNNNNNNNNDNDDDLENGHQCQKYYKSVAGDNCENIAQKHGITAQRFHKMNSFINCDDIWVNTRACVDKKQ